MRTTRQMESDLQTPEGILNLQGFLPGESDPLEFKELVNHRSPADVEELRADCAGLASTGHGFLIVGVKQLHDGTNRMGDVCGVTNPADLKRSVEDLLGHGFDPPIRRRQVWLVEISGRGTVVVVSVYGRAGYPIELPAKKEEPRFVIREAGKKRWLRSAEARQRRRDLDAPRRRMPVIVATTVSATLAVVATYWQLWLSPRQQPIQSASAVVQLRLAWPQIADNQGWTSEYTGDIGYFAFGRGNQALLVLRSSHGVAKKMEGEEVTAVDYYDLTSPLALKGVPLRVLEQAEFVQVSIPAVTSGSSVRIMDGKISGVLNLTQPFAFSVPPQETDAGFILVRPDRILQP